MLIIIFHISMDNCQFAPTPLCMFVFAYIYIYMCVHVFVYSICVCVCVNLYSFRLRFYLTRNVQFYSVLFCFFRLQCEHVYVSVCAVYVYGVCVCLVCVCVSLVCVCVCQYLHTKHVCQLDYCQIQMFSQMHVQVCASSSICISLPTSLSISLFLFPLSDRKRILLLTRFLAEKINSFAHAL